MRYSALFAFLTILPLGAQMGRRAAAPDEGMEILVAVFPMTGAGTYTDPKRPLGMPAQGALPGVAVARYVIADDGRTAAVYLAAKERGAFEPMRNTGRADVETFEPHKDTKDKMEKALEKVKKGLKLDDLKAENKEVRP